MRDILPNRRHNETLVFNVKGIRYKATLGYYKDGHLGEVFLNAAKLDSTSDIAAREAAICVSMALQYGAPVETIATAFPRSPDGKPEGPLGTLFDKLTER